MSAEHEQAAGLVRENESSQDSESRGTGTTPLQTFIHLTKGYIGPGCLSLPWAISELGIVGGVIGIIAVSVWTSYNCWTIVQLKQIANDDNINTFADVSGWLIGPKWRKFTTICIMVQQLAVCTVFLSFMGANIQAVWQEIYGHELGHGPSITLCLPAVMALTCIPNLKALAPATAVGALLLFSGFGCLLVVIVLEWNQRPHNPIETDRWNAPMAICAILYSYEGVCLMLPVENAMEDPHKFPKPFVGSMSLAAVVFCLVATLSVMAFGPIENGSITAYLLETFGDSSWRGWIMVANGLVSLSVLVTFPLQMFPALELANPWFERSRLSSLFPQNQVFASLPAEDNEHEQEVLGPSTATPEVDAPQIGSLNISQNSGSASSDHRQGLSTPSPITRITLVLVTFIIAVGVPNVQALISLSGALSGSSSTLLLPPALQIAYKKRFDGGRNVLFSYVSFSLGFVFLCIGTVASLYDIVRVYKNKD